MKQRQLEERVREIFEQQGFEVKETEEGFKAENSTSFDIRVFSSEKFDEEDVVEDAGNGLVFVDEELSDVKDELENEVSIIKDEEEEEYELPSFEIIGDVAVINELVDLSKEEAVEGILASNPNVGTVLLKTDSLSGEFRVGDYEKLYGEETETVHKEFGCRFKVDPTKVYFSERFSTERKRVIDQIEDGEKVLVMFAGVGPFAILAAKHARPSKVVAVEKNPVAADYLKQNVELNSVEDIVEAYEGDVEEVVPELGEEFDRIIMPLPGNAIEFLDLAVNTSSENSVIHMYAFSSQGEKSRLEEAVRARIESGKQFLEKIDFIESGDRSPSEKRYCVEMKMKKKRD